MNNNPTAELPPLSKNLEEVLHRLIEHVENMQKAFDLIAARSIAHEATLNALITTHPNPRNLFEAHASQLDAYTEGRSVNPQHDFRKELRHFQTEILRAINSPSPHC